MHGEIKDSNSTESIEESMEFICKKPLFGKEVEIVVFDMHESLAKEVCEVAYLEGLRLNKIFNYYNPKSELSQLNNKRKLCVSKELLEVIICALALAKETDGTYDISKGAEFNARKQGTEMHVECNYEDIIIINNEIILNHPDVSIDLGSIAKGYIVDKMIAALQKQGVNAGLVDGRGDMCIFGKQEIIGIQHPRNPKEIINSIQIENSAVVTSGDYNQYQETFSKSHIINQKELAAITIVAESAMIADAFATALFVVDKEKRITLIKNHPELKVLTIDTETHVEMYNGFEAVIVKR